MAGLLAQIVGKPVTVENSTAAATMGNITAGVLATYETGTGEIAAICVSDLEMVANAGAALCMMPPYVAQESIKAQRLIEPTLLENYQEVLNICARLFSNSTTNRIRLRNTETVSKVDCKSLVLGPGCAQREITLKIAGYGSGRIWICTQKAFNSVLF